jgi:hypothetical protein
MGLDGAGGAAAGGRVRAEADAAAGSGADNEALGGVGKATAVVYAGGAGSSIAKTADGSKSGRKGLLKPDGQIIGVSGKKGSPGGKVLDQKYGRVAASGGEDRSLENLAAAAAAAAAGEIPGVGGSYGGPTSTAALPSQLLPLNGGMFQAGMGKGVGMEPSGPYSIVEKNTQLQETIAYAENLIRGSGGTLPRFGSEAYYHGPAGVGSKGQSIGAGQMSAFRPPGGPGQGARDDSNGGGGVPMGVNGSGDWGGLVSKVENRLDVLLEDRKRKRQLEEEIEGLKVRVMRLEAELGEERRLRVHAEEQLAKLSGLLLSKLDPGET